MREGEIVDVLLILSLRPVALVVALARAVALAVILLVFVVCALGELGAVRLLCSGLALVPDAPRAVLGQMPAGTEVVTGPFFIDLLALRAYDAIAACFIWCKLDYKWVAIKVRSLLKYVALGLGLRTADTDTCVSSIGPNCNLSIVAAIA